MATGDEIPEDLDDDLMGEILENLEGAPCICCNDPCGEESFLHCDPCIHAGCRSREACKRLPQH